ncbi:hypothetical protein Ddye_027157 [Dipteronia dyeriana]|uniref:Uncharacterized protein n=1 Tax=Dipteronia dyeriana TaxID=168575 RepID=A0AAD9WR43_9ROSI|nr:hypothetical protein Ddye_027157 [Dipteronia dyeriana]
MKLGWDLKTGLQRRLSSWTSPDDPSPGDFTWGIELQGNPQFVMWNGSNKFHRGGPWNGITFSGSLDLSHISIFEVNFVNNEDVMQGLRGPIRLRGSALHGRAWPGHGPLLYQASRPAPPTHPEARSQASLRGCSYQAMPGNGPQDGLGVQVWRPDKAVGHAQAMPGHAVRCL